MLLLLALAAGCEGGGAPIVVELPDGGRDAGADLIFFDAAQPIHCERSCAPLGPCDRARCDGEACVHEGAADGEVCTGDASGVCVEAECRARGCGDGWREPGPEPAREGCDHREAGAFCDASCAPVVGALIEGVDVADGRDLAAGVDGEGQVLVVRVERSREGARLWGHRFDRRLRAAGAAIDLAYIDNPTAELAPAVAGLARGWAIAMVRPPEGVVVGVLDAGGAAVELRPWSPGASTDADPRLAPLDEGFVLVANDLVGAIDDPLGGLRARLFDGRAGARGEAFRVAVDRGGFEQIAGVAGAGGAWTVAWSVTDPSAKRLRARARSFAGRAPIGGEVELGLEESDVWEPALAPLEDGRVAAAWLEANKGAISIASARLGAAGALEPAMRVEGESVVLAPRAVGLSGEGFALFYVEGGARGVLRSAASGQAPPELARMAELGLGTDARLVRGLETILAIWRDRGTRSVRALAVPSR